MIIIEASSRLRERDLDPIYLMVKIDGERVTRCLTDLAWSEVLEWAIRRGEAIAEAKYGENVGEDLKLSARLQLMTGIAERLHEALRSLGDALDVYTSRCEKIPEDAMPVQNVDASEKIN